MNTLCLYTLFFPYGNGESFIIPEVEILAREFDRIIILPLHKTDGMRALSQNVSCTYLFENISYSELGLTSMIKWTAAYLKKYGIDNLRYEAANYKRMLAKVAIWKNWFAGIEKTSVHYSYWFDEWVTILGLAKLNFPDLKVVARAHGFDLYKNRAGASGFPYRELQFRTVDKVFPVSKNGSDYLKSNYPKFQNKIETAYLGSKDAGFNTNIPKEFHVVSIANLVELKRVDLIIESLKLINKPMRWTHFGNGILREKLEELAKKLPDHIIHEFKGNVDHNALLNYLSHTPISIILNLSSSEGLPVSMMEAQSAGIPIVSSNVGGVSEIVNDWTGILLDPNPKPIRVAKTIENLIKEPGSLNFDDERIRENWVKKFDAKKNFHHFGKYLKGLLP